MHRTACKIRLDWKIVELDNILSNLVSNVDGAIGAAIGGMDGLLVEQFSNEAKLDLSSIVAEHSNLLRNASIAYEITGLHRTNHHRLFLGTDPRAKR
jgi:predicted regulator of Ras-like GTPase activity (Roadblock/LC7/MglB family)